jgi:hypothetical protein
LRAEDRRQRTEGRRLRAGGRGQKKEVGSRNAEGGIKKRSAKSIAQSVQKVENKRITTEGHGETREI